MTERIRFYFDEHIPLAVSRALQRQGIDVLTARDAGRVGVTDIEQLVFATQQNRIMVTMDSDFLALAARGTPHADIAYARLGGRSIGELVRGLALIYEVLNREQMNDHVEYV